MTPPPHVERSRCIVTTKGSFLILRLSGFSQVERDIITSLGLVLLYGFFFFFILIMAVSVIMHVHFLILTHSYFIEQRSSLTHDKVLLH